MSFDLNTHRPTRWHGPLKWVCTDDGSRGTSFVQSLTELNSDRLHLSIAIEDGNNWCGVFEQTSGREYSGEMTYVAGEDEMEIDEQTGALARMPDDTARVSLRLRKAKGGLTIRGKWTYGESGGTYDWTANLSEVRRSRRTKHRLGASW